MSQLELLATWFENDDAHVRGINRKHRCTACPANTREGLRTGIDINSGGQIEYCRRCMTPDGRDLFPEPTATRAQTRPGYTTASWPR